MAGSIAFAASDERASEALELASAAGNSALSGVIAAYFACAGAYPGVFFSPLTLCFRGFGAERALDGRARQPGKGLKRPRGFLPQDRVPNAAYVGIPTALLACQVGLSYNETRGLATALRPAITAAKQVGAKARANMFEQLARGGAAALGSDAILRPLLQVAGPAQGGNLGAADLKFESQIDYALELDGDTLRAPWFSDHSEFAGETHAIVAVDRRGGCVALCYGKANEGVLCEPLEVVLPRVAHPVRRGEPRVRPETPLEGPSNACLQKVETDYAALAKADMGLLRVSPAWNS